MDPTPTPMRPPVLVTPETALVDVMAWVESVTPRTSKVQVCIIAFVGTLVSQLLHILFLESSISPIAGLLHIAATMAERNQNIAMNPHIGGPFLATGSSIAIARKNIGSEMIADAKAKFLINLMCFSSMYLK